MITLVNKSIMSTYTTITDDDESGFSAGQGAHVDESVVFGETVVALGSFGRVQFVHPPSALHRSQVQ